MPPKKRLFRDGGRRRLFSDGGFSRFGLENVGLGAEIFRFDGGGGVSDLKYNSLYKDDNFLKECYVHRRRMYT